MMYASDNPLLYDVAALAARCGAEKLVLFGSRARGDHRLNSDVDLAVWGVPQEQQGVFWWHLEELPTLLKFDVVHVCPELDPGFLRSIQKDGVTLYEKNR